MFDDRRVTGDRRKYHDPEAIPPAGCRRATERRDLFRQYEPLPWWLQTNYAEEMQPPLLEQDSASRARRQQDQPLPPTGIWNARQHRRH